MKKMSDFGECPHLLPCLGRRSVGDAPGRGRGRRTACDLALRAVLSPVHGRHGQHREIHRRGRGRSRGIRPRPVRRTALFIGCGRGRLPPQRPNEAFFPTRSCKRKQPKLILSGKKLNAYFPNVIWVIHPMWRWQSLLFLVAVAFRDMSLSLPIHTTMITRHIPTTLMSGYCHRLPNKAAI